MSEVGWRTSTLLDLVDDAIGGLWGSAPGSDKQDEADVLVVRGADFRDWSNRRALDAAPRRVPTRSLTRRILEPGDLVIEVSGGSPTQPVGRVVVIDDLAVSQVSRPLICSNFCRKLRLKPGVDPFFVKRQLDWLYHSGHADRFQTSTTNIRNLQVDDFLAGTQITLPPRAVQKQLTALLDTIDDKRASSSNHLLAARRAIERFRQAVLAAGCTGRLTADWREERSSEATTNLLKDLARQREQAIGRRHKEAAAPADYDFDVPEGWDVSSLDRVSVRVTSGSRDWSRFYGRGSGTFVMAQNVRRGYLDWSFRQPVDPPEGDVSRERSQIEVGDLLVTIVGANTGDVGAVTEPRREHYVCQSVALVRPADARLTPFLNLWFRSPEHGRNYFEDCIYGAGRPHLSFDQLRAAPVALPPLAEQQEIVRRVGKLLSLADGLTHRVDVASRRVHRTAHAVLAKAFHGEMPSSGSEQEAAEVTPS